MDSIVRFFFEDLLLMLMAQFVTLSIVLAVHRRYFTTRTRRAVWITLGLCAALLAMHILVKTDREQIRLLVKELAKAVDQPDMDFIAAALDEQFYDPRYGDRAAFLVAVEQQLQRLVVDAASVWRFQRIEVSDGQAMAEFQAICDVRSSGYSQNRLPSLWELSFIKRNGTWKVDGAILLRVGQYDGRKIDYLRY